MSNGIMSGKLWMAIKPGFPPALAVMADTMVSTEVKAIVPKNKLSKKSGQF